MPSRTMKAPSDNRMMSSGRWSSLYTAEKAYWVENSAYTNDLPALGWKPEGKVYYSYGFSGAEGTNYIKAELESDIGALSHAKADKSGFIAVAGADIDGDSKFDVLTIDDKKELKIVQDDLK